MSRLFISHSSANNAAALALTRWLSEQGFDDIFLDVDPQRGLVAGDRWQEALRAAADRCEAVLFLVSPAWLASNWCLTEFLLTKTLHKRIFGLIVEPVALESVPVEMTAEWQLCRLVGDGEQQTFDIEIGGVREQVSFLENGLNMLRRGLGRAGLDARNFPWPPPNDPNRAPYRGLRALEPQDAAIFFGRDAAIVRALDRLRGLVEGGVAKLLVVLGASGSGKSSFLRAGLWPRLARDDVMFLPLPAIRPETAVITGASGLAAALSAAFERLGTPRVPGRIKESLAEGAPGFIALLNDLAELAKRRLVTVDKAAAAPTVVLSIDQAEELFNPDGAAEADAFLDLLSAVILPGGAVPAPSVFVLATIRSDRFELVQNEARFADVKRELVDLPPIPTSEFKSVIEGPARRVVEANGRLTIDPALTEQLIADAQGADALPLLSFTLERLYADYGGDGNLTLAEYRKLGGVQGSIEAAVAGAMAEPGRAPAIPAAKEAQLEALRAAFIPWLARIAPDTGTPMRRVSRMDEIPQASRTIVERLVAARLLIADRRAGVDVVEVAHESLLRQWPALAAWLQADAGDLTVIEGVERAAAEWARNNRHPAWLDHRSERLVAAERLVAREDFRKRLGEEGMAYLAACREREDAELREKEEALLREQARLTEIAAAQERTARLQRRARTTLAAMAALVIVGLALGIWQHRTNLTLQTSLDSQRSALELSETSLFVKFATVERLRGNLDAALRFAVHGARMHLQLKQPAAATALAGVELGSVLSQVRWVLSLGGHTGNVSSASFSPDGKRILTASGDQTARLWDAITGKELMVLRGHEDGLQSASFSPEGRRIVTASRDGTARIWNAATGEQVAVLRGHGKARVPTAVFSPDGIRIVTASFDRTARIWDAKTAEPIMMLRGHDAEVQSAAYSPDGTRIVTASDDGTARIWDTASGQQLLVLRGHDDPVYSASYSPDGSRVVTSSNDNTARIWDAATGKEILVLRGHDQYVNGADFSPDGKLLVTASGDKTVRLWEVASGREIAVLRGHVDPLNTAVFSPDGTHILSSSNDATARLWNTTNANEVAILRGHEHWVMGAAASRDGAWIVTASEDKTARVWDAHSGEPIAVLRGHEAGILSAAFNPDHTRVVTASEDKTARIWDARSGEPIAILRGHDNWVMSAAYSPDGTRIATGSWDWSIRLWDAGTAREIRLLRGHTGIVQSITFNSDGTRLLTASRDRTARVWDASNGNELVVLRGHEGDVYAAAFSPDGKLIVTGSQDKTARVWDATTGSERLILRGHEGTVNATAFSPDGTRVATASDDSTLRLWDAATGAIVATLRGHAGSVQSVVFLPDGARAVTASRDRTARIWDVRLPAVTTEQQVTEVCTRRLRGLSKLTRDDMRLAGLPDSAPPIDMCAGIGE